jgi:N6-adenosine-specific RNA methylase IME4|tara:strand:+ start:1647 stop:2105 length:459 start_codon:yes stop_codon:yes gene_type:complete
MKTPDILRTVLQSGEFNPDPEGCALFMWVTNSFLKDGLWLMEGLGFRYVTNLCWLKKGNPGLGQWFRSRHELLLFGTRGRAVVRNVRTERRDLPGGALLPRPGKHSTKPEVFYKIIEARTVGPRLEMFARNTREDWSSWGNEVPAEGQRKTE